MRLIVGAKIDNSRPTKKQKAMHIFKSITIAVPRINKSGIKKIPKSMSNQLIPPTPHLT